MNRPLVMLILLLLLWNCTPEESIEGLWVVEKVVVGEQENTPNGRWTRFNADGTQQSGNGWFQHSVGIWNWDKDKSEITVYNSNGVKDLFDPFNVRLMSDTMFWSRIEEGQRVTVTLCRADELPQSYGDKLLGLWKLEKSEGEGPYYGQTPSTVETLFLRWDRRFVMRTSQGTINGVYNVHGHRPEIEFIPYGEKRDRSFWAFEASHSSVRMRLLNSDTTVVRNFIRTDQFPE